MALEIFKTGFQSSQSTGEAQLYVTNVANAGLGSLRDAITQANALPGANTITLQASGTIVLSSALPTITGDLVIEGPGVQHLAVQRCELPGTPEFRLLTVAAGANVQVAGLTLRNGQSPDGGAIRNSGFLTVKRCAIIGNSASGNGGGGIFNSGDLTVEDTTIARNGSTFAGGGMLQIDGGFTQLNRCTISDNTALNGGGLLNQGIKIGATMRLEDCTISGNTATQQVGGIYNIANGNPAAMVILRTTVYGNSGPPGSGALLNANTSGSFLLLNSSIVAGNAGTDLGGKVSESQGYNLIGNGDGVSGLVSSDIRGSGGAIIDPMLGPLAGNGGATLTHLPLSGSPAVDHGPPGAIPVDVPRHDQRGALYTRLFNGRMDIGAVESTQKLTITTLADDGPGSLRAAITSANEVPGVNELGFSVTGTIVLESALPELLDDLIIAGPGANQLSIERSTAPGTPEFRIFRVVSTTDVTLSGLTLRNGNSPNGGAISNSGRLTVQRCTISGNLATANGGGGILNWGNLTMEDTTVSGNQSTFGGGGVLQINGGTATLRRCTLSGNIAPQGGGVLNQGITLATDMQVEDCTVYGNSASQAVGGIFNISNGATTTMAISRTTVTRNSGWPGVYNPANAGSFLHLGSCIVAGNEGPDLAGVVSDSQGYNLIGDSGGIGGLVLTDLRGTSTKPLDPLLTVLGEWGGETATTMPLPGSPAIDGARGGPGPGGWLPDQRGQQRPVGPYPDIGAVEAVALSLLNLTSFDGDAIPDLLEGTPPYAHLDPLLDDGGVDTDGDGFTDEQEIASMTNLFDPLDFLRISSFGPAPSFDPLTNPVFSVTWKSFPGLSYHLEHSEALDFGAASAMGPFIPTDATHTETIRLKNGKDFVRLRND